MHAICTCMENEYSESENDILYKNIFFTETKVVQLSY